MLVFFTIAIIGFDHVTRNPVSLLNSVVAKYQITGSKVNKFYSN
jgi:hypothetical protein